ncbi:beta-1,3-galactosyltransferase 1-like [Ylistrum balloti]|uniref:beta-1,3-galactosyltransferase 1-like n=1 Tax=Ylistrum balloti TaxID=509963 RepID=UPI002905DEE5|nr:beta-1,3-galactosyltransferase 1-like [Ylistrum balloti]
MNICLNLRTLIKLEACVLYVVLWLCLMTVHFQSWIIPKHYHTPESDIALQNYKPRGESENSGHHSNKTAAQIYTGPSNSDVMKWFIHGPKLVQLPQKSRKHPHLMSYDVQKEVCHRGAVHLLIYIHSAPQNGYKRDEIRNTWAGVHNFKEIYVERVFLVGETDDKQVIENVENERKQQDDIILCHFKDSFRNMSLKAIALLDFVNNRCTQAKYILKTDDDIFVDMYALIEKIIPQIMKKPKSIVCERKYNHSIVTDRNSKWYIPPDLLTVTDKGKLPTFCTGYAVLFTSDLVPLLLNASYETPLVQVDDVYMFGFLLKRVPGVNVIDSVNSFTLNQELGMTEYQDRTKPIEHFVVSASEKGTQEKLWQNAIDKVSLFGKEIMNHNLLPYEY